MGEGDCHAMRNHHGGRLGLKRPTDGVMVKETAPPSGGVQTVLRFGRKTEQCRKTVHTEAISIHTKFGDFKVQAVRFRVSRRATPAETRIPTVSALAEQVNNNGCFVDGVADKTGK